MKRYHGEVKSRNEVWCKKVTTENSNVPSSCVPIKTLKTYSRIKKTNHTEINTQNEQQKPEKDPTTSKPPDMNWQLNDPTDDSDEVIVDQDPLDDLAGLSGNRIVDLAHVLQWAFKLERHRSQCGGSSIVYMGELKDGLNTIFKFKCTMCGEHFRNSNVNEKLLSFKEL